jgi:hypothetical protein
VGVECPAAGGNAPRFTDRHGEGGAPLPGEVTACPGGLPNRVPDELYQKITTFFSLDQIVVLTAFAGLMQEYTLWR